jgi:drug/metabolite transporter (DMT)-like permease
MLGALLALMAAASFGFNAVSARRGVLTGSVFQGLAITVPIGLPMFLIPAMVTGGVWEMGSMSPLQWFYFSAAGIVHFVVARYCNFRAVQAIGANLASAIIQPQIMVTLVLALLFLDERLTVLKMIGIAFAFGGAATTLYGRGRKSTLELKFTPRYFEGYVFGLICACGYGVSPILIRAATSDVGQVIVGGLISYLASTVVVVGILLTSRRRLREVLNTNREAGKWFVTTGIAVNISQFLRYVALSIAPVVVVAPIIQLAGVFQLIFAWFINRDYEVFDLRTVAGILLAFSGAVLLAIDGDTFANTLGLSDGLRGFLALSWP